MDIRGGTLPDSLVFVDICVHVGVPFLAPGSGGYLEMEVSILTLSAVPVNVVLSVDQ
jgi:hypothetical protein